MATISVYSSYDVYVAAGVTVELLMGGYIDEAFWDVSLIPLQTVPPGNPCSIELIKQRLTRDAGQMPQLRYTYTNNGAFPEYFRRYAIRVL
jgi:hypothetical protein